MANENATWIDDVLAAMIGLNKTATNEEIYEEVRRIREANGRSWPKSASAIVRRTLQEQSRDTQSFKGNDLFESADGIGLGRWRIRTDAMQNRTLDYTIRRVLSEYNTAKSESFREHPLASFLRSDAPSILRQNLNLYGDRWKVVGSPGKSKWSDVPWIAIMDELITDTTQAGYYVVVLFSVAEQSAHLCLGQGVQSVFKKFGRDAPNILKSRSDVIRSKVPLFANDFAIEAILNVEDGKLARKYRNSIIFSKTYRLDSLPSNETIVGDFNNALRHYQDVIAKGGFDLGDDQAELSEGYDGLSVDERKFISSHVRYEGRVNSKKIKKFLGSKCQACGFVYSAKYGELGEDFIEVHHLVPFSKLIAGHSRTLNFERDFAVLCANCHRMVHRLSDPSDISKLKMIMNEVEDKST